MKLRIVCPCGRNLADVYQGAAGYDRPYDLAVAARPNVRQDEYEHPGGITRRDVTYTWRCYCGQDWERRHSWIVEQWKTREPWSGIVRVSADAN